MLNEENTARERDVRECLRRNIILFVPVALILYLLSWIPIPAYFLLGAIAYGSFVGATTAKSLRASGFFGAPFWTILAPVLTGFLATCIQTASINMALVSGLLGSIIGAAIVGLCFVTRVSQRHAGLHRLITRITWFFIGFIVSWMTWYAINYVRLRPRNYKVNLPEATLEVMGELEELGEPVLQWLGHAYGRKFSNYKVFTPADSLDASAVIESLNTSGLPLIIIEDEDANGTLDSITVADSTHRTFEFNDTNGDGTFDTYHYNTGFDTEWKSFRDDNMDGQYDIRFNPDHTIDVFIDSKWRTATLKDEMWFVEIEGTMTPVELSPVKKKTTNE